jgi:hypothetical protein
VIKGQLAIKGQSETKAQPEIVVNKGLMGMEE